MNTMNDSVRIIIKAMVFAKEISIALEAITLKSTKTRIYHFTIHIVALIQTAVHGLKLHLKNVLNWLIYLFDLVFRQTQHNV